MLLGFAAVHYRMRPWTTFQDFVMRKLPSMLMIMAVQLFIEMAKLSFEWGTKGLAETRLLH